MLRFVFNFVIFGFLFFLVAKFFPDAFTKLVNAADYVYDVLQNVVMLVVDKLQELKPPEAS